MKISACMIVKNEEKNIKKCIDSYKDVVDEIIVVDTGSTDNSVKIAQNLGAKVFYFQWINDFSKAKNFALSKASGDWIVFLDADEYFDKSQSENLRKIIKKYGKGDVEIIACKMFNIDENTGENLADFPQTRIFKNTGNIVYINSIHERLHSKKKRIRAVYVEENELVIYHTGYSSDRIISKAERNLEMLLEEHEKGNSDSTILHFLSDTYLTLKNYEKSIEYAKKFISSGVDIVGLNSKVYQNLITAMVESHYEWDEVYDVVYEAIDKFPKHPMFQMYLARCHHYTKRYEKALESYMKTVDLQAKYNELEINFITGKVHEIECFIASILELKNNEPEAIEYYCRALRRKKDYIPAILGLIKFKNEIEMIELLNTIYDKENLSEMLFLNDILTKERSGKILTYYVSLIDKMFNHQDFSMIIMFLVNERYDIAYKHFYEAYTINYENSYAKLAILSAYLVGDYDGLNRIKNRVKPSYKRIIEGMTSKKEDAYLYKEDMVDYLDILRELIKLDKYEDIDNYMNLKSKFISDKDELYSLISYTLTMNGYYEMAILQYKEVLNLENIEKKYTYFNIGYCYYKIRSEEESLKYFEQALECGYLENDIESFLVWIRRKEANSEVSEYAQSLIEKFKYMKSL